MMTKEETLHKVELRICQLKEMLEKSIEAGDRIDEFERDCFAVLLDLGFELLSGFVAEHGDGDRGEQCEHDGKTLQRLPNPHQRRYVSIYGPLQIERHVYGSREGQAIEYVPLDAQLGLPAGEVSYVLEDWLERMCVKDAFRDSVDSLVDLLGVRAKVSVDTAEEHSRQMAQFASSFRASQTMAPADDEGEILVATADGKGVPMRKPRSDPDSAEPSKHRRGKGEKKNKKQMAYVGAVYTINRFRRTADDIVDDLLRKKRASERPQPQHKHVWAEMTRPADELRDGILLHGPSYLFAEMAVECSQRDESREKPLVCLLDGEKQLWDMKEDWLSRAVGILDIFHVNERLWTVAHCFHSETSDEAKQFVEKYLRLLLEGKVNLVIRSFRQLLGKRRLSREKKRRVEAAITYYENNRAHMRYDEYLEEGYPIGSGVAEGACRYLVKDRLERTGMRWNLDGAQAMLHLRALYLNGDWRPFITHRIEQEQHALYGQAA